jgi:hypothetical protein
MTEDRLSIHPFMQAMASAAAPLHNARRQAVRRRIDALQTGAGHV